MTHSMHIDLIQFHTMDEYRLNMVPNTNNCTFYSVDFFMKFAKNCKNDIQFTNSSLKAS